MGVRTPAGVAGRRGGGGGTKSETVKDDSKHWGGWQGGLKKKNSGQMDRLKKGWAEGMQKPSYPGRLGGHFKI